MIRFINQYLYDGSNIFTWNAILLGFLSLSIIGLIACGGQSEDDISSETPAATEPVAATKPESNQNSTSNQPSIDKPTTTPTTVPTAAPTTVPTATPTTATTPIPTATAKPTSAMVSNPTPTRRELGIEVDINCNIDQLQAKMFVASSLPSGAVDAVQEWVCISAQVFFDRPNVNWEMAGPIYVVMVDRNDLNSTLEVEKHFCSYIVENHDKGGIRNHACNPKVIPADRGCEFGKCLVVDEQGNVHGSSISSSRQEDGFYLFISSSHDWPQHHHGYKTTTLHEMFHIFQISNISDNGYSYEEVNKFLGIRSGDNQEIDVPWWMEGTATYLADLHYSLQTNDPDWLIGEATRNLWTDYDDSGRGTIINRYLESGKKLYNIGYDSDRRIAYSVGFWFVAYIINQVGEDKIYDFYAELEKHGFEKSFEIHFGKTYREYIDDFDIFLSKSRSEILSILPNSVPISTPKPKSTPTPTPTPTPTITAKEKLISIGYNVPIVGSVDEARQEYVASLDIPEKYRQRFIEVQENLNSVLGGYPNYIYIAYNPNGTEEDAKPVFERMAQLYPIDNNGNPFKDWTIAELINRQSCLGGADPGRGDPSTTNPYSVCLEDLDFIQTPWGEEIEHPYRSDIKMILHLAHEYFHHYQRVHALDRGLDYQADRNNPETTVQAPTWWIEGAAVAFQNAWYRENWQSLPLLKDLTLGQALSTNIATVADARVYKEARSNMMGNGNSEKCTPDWYMSSLDETYDTYTGCNATFMAAAYLGYITSYKTVWIDIPQDYYDLGFWGSFEKHVGMNKQEFYDSYNQFLRTGDPDDEPPEGWAPPENYISEHADFLKIIPESD